MVRIFTAMVWVQSLVEEMRSHGEQGMAKTKKNQARSNKNNVLTLEKAKVGQERRSTGAVLRGVSCHRCLHGAWGVGSAHERANSVFHSGSSNPNIRKEQNDV